MPARHSPALAAFSAELFKARTFPPIARIMLLGALFLFLAGIFAISQMALFDATGRGEELGGATPSEVLLVVLHYGQIVPILLGTWIIGQDSPQGAHRTAFLAAPHRGILFVAKIATAACCAVLAAILCVLTSYLPIALTGSPPSAGISISAYGWVVAYWGTLAAITAAIAAATRSIIFTIVPILAWNLGISNLIILQIPVLSGALDHTFATAYLSGGTAPTSAALIASCVQVLIALAIGAVTYTRRDSQ